MNEPVPEEKLAAVKAAIAAGEKIQAINLYRKLRPGVGLKEAKEAVERMERGEPAKLPGLAPAIDTQEIHRAIFQGQKIQAIKLYREQKGGGLKEAKEAIEQLESRLRASSPHEFASNSPKGCLSLIAVISLVAAAILGWAFGR